MKPGALSRLLWADLLKVIAMYAVVLIHSAAPLLVAYRERGPTAWWVGNLYDSLARWAIPVFFMLSGSFLMGPAGSAGLGAFLGHRFRRIGIPFLAWSAVYFAWSNELNHQDVPYRALFLHILRTPAYYHLWFLYALMGLYLLAPLLSVYLRAAPHRNVVYFLLLWFAFGSVVPTVESYFGLPVSFMTSAPSSVFRYIGFFVLGFLLRTTRCSVRHCFLLALAFLLGFLATALGTYFVTVVNNGARFVGVFYEYYSPNVLVMAVSLFVLFKSGVGSPSGRLSRAGSRFVTVLAGCVPGIYLVHALIIAILKRGLAGVVLDQYTPHPSVGVPLFALVVFCLSFGIVYIIRLIPGVRRLVP